MSCSMDPIPKLSGLHRSWKVRIQRIQFLNISKYRVTQEPKEFLERNINNHAIIRNISFLGTFQRAMEQVSDRQFG